MSIRNKIFMFLLALMLVPVVSQADLYNRWKPKKINKVANDVQKTAVDETEYFPEAFPQEDEIKRYERKTGSLWMDTYQSQMYNNLHRASRIGDMVTIVVTEQTQGKKSAETKAERKGSQKMGITGLFGLVSKLTAWLGGMDAENMVNGSSETKHDGKGETKRSGSLESMITARVIKVLRNGDMQLRGQKNIKVNGEEQVLTIEGFVRPYDIASDNTVKSIYIADARINLNGFGVVADQQKPGWLQRIFQTILPF